MALRHVLFLLDGRRQCNNQLQRPALLSPWIDLIVNLFLFFKNETHEPFLFFSESCILYLKQSVVFSGVKKKRIKKNNKRLRIYGKATKDVDIYTHTHFISYTVYIYINIWSDVCLSRNFLIWKASLFELQHDYYWACSFSQYSIRPSALGSTVPL